MQNSPHGPTRTRPNETKLINKLPVHHPSKSVKSLYRSSRSHYKSYKYADIGFTITKTNKKYVAHCKVCNRTLGNTAYARLKGHRNICREASPTNSEEECPLFPEINNATYVSKENDLDSTKSNSHVSRDDSTITLNIEIEPKIENLECEVNANHLSQCNSDEDSQILNEDNQLKLNIIEVLLPIKYNKKLLFEDTTQKSINMWIKVLKNAQNLNLAPTDVTWTYARDTLYSHWRHHTLQKKDAIDSGELDVKYNIVDLVILQIEDTPMLSDSACFENENSFETANNSNFDKTIDKTTENSQPSENVWSAKNRNSISTQTSDEVIKTELRLKLLQCEAMEIENYKRCLEALELERKLQIPNSKFTAKYFPTTLNRSNEQRRDDSSNLIKIEIDD
ncbi:uncharacterized protein LOC129939971 isoform X2 [Eupeodes corollae]|uniref:uncharacterized protein LOC129939971 isoform X2 n=1 Tax=Eupeodes corollae TaxID=290404 RepID=UPI00248F5207|nr:uncharacterized protein LOC129939971 isoform X2 [Eupeodes corollae]